MKALVQYILNATAAGKAWLLAADAAAQKALLSLVKADVGLGNVDNTADANKPVSTAQAAAIAAKIGGSVGATTNRLVKSSGTDTLTVQSTGITVDASNNVSGVGTISSGAITSSGQLTLTGSVAIVGTVGGVSVPIGGNGYRFASGGFFTCQSTGVFTLQDNAATSFGRLQFGGTTSAFPALRRSGAALNSRLADDSADADFTAKAITASGAWNLAPITKSALLLLTPNAATGGRWRVTDATPANREAYPTGTDWRYSSDDTVVT